MNNSECRVLSVAPMLQRRSLYQLELYFILHLVVDYRLTMIHDHCLYSAYTLSVFMNVTVECMRGSEIWTL